MCLNKKCKKRLNCLRFTAKPGKYQSYSAFTGVDEKCFVSNISQYKYFTEWPKDKSGPVELAVKDILNRLKSVKRQLISEVNEDLVNPYHVHPCPQCGKMTPDFIYQSNGAKHKKKYCCNNCRWCAAHNRRTHFLPGFASRACAYIYKKRAQRRKEGKCAMCGVPSSTFRCPDCSERKSP